MRSLTDAVRLVRLQKDERLVISQMVRLACAAIAWQVTWAALQTNGWSEPQLAGLQSEWQQIDYARDMGRAMEMERAMTLAHFEELAASRSKLNQALLQRERVGEILGKELGWPTRGVVLRWIHMPLWRVAWLQQDELRSVARWNPLVEVGRLAQRESWLSARALASRLNVDAEGGSWFFRADEPDKQNWYDRWRYLFSNEGFGIGSNLLLRVAKAETERRMMVCALALRRYQLRQGHPAPSLKALVPDWLPSVLADGMDGKPLRYRLNPDGSFLLYSVGEDGVDDGGDPSLIKGKSSFKQIWDGKDAVWPQPASTEEAVQAAHRSQ